MPATDLERAGRKSEPHRKGWRTRRVNAAKSADRELVRSVARTLRARMHLPALAALEAR